MGTVFVSGGEDSNRRVCLADALLKAHGLTGLSVKIMQRLRGGEYEKIAVDDFKATQIDLAMTSFPRGQALMSDTRLVVIGRDSASWRASEISKAGIPAEAITANTPNFTAWLSGYAMGEVDVVRDVMSRFRGPYLKVTAAEIGQAAASYSPEVSALMAEVATLKDLLATATAKLDSVAALVKG